ncbi:uncharacterized protein LOC136079093 [Hydra vulgaris]|uniref:Uncharacterized protein LOC136079093 n=1 Tax=Hydra vulgaris TaxID=6087 RepID=A0ABM4BP54_HYDVU
MLMHKLYLELNKDQNQLIVGYHFYYVIFMYNFILGIGHHATDTCSTCHAFKLAIKDVNLSNASKQTKTALYILHRRKAQTFYSLLNDIRPNEITILFDMMENLVLPKLPIGEAYYSRQLYLYVLGVVVHRGNQTQHLNDVNFFIWLEFENCKDSNMICSALQHFLIAYLFDSCSNASVLRLFSDSCYGQNKNINMVSMLLSLRKQHFRNLLITHTFPERGHSYLPADRVFGRVQQDIKKHEQILEPDIYRDILSRHGRVFVFGQDWSALDFKAEVKKFAKIIKTFKISEGKKLIINSNHLEIAQCSYHSEPTSHSLLKKGKKWDTFKPSIPATKNCVKNV